MATLKSAQATLKSLKAKQRAKNKPPMLQEQIALQTKIVAELKAKQKADKPIKSHRSRQLSTRTDPKRDQSTRPQPQPQSIEPAALYENGSHLGSDEPTDEPAEEKPVDNIIDAVFKSNSAGEESSYEADMESPVSSSSENSHESKITGNLMQALQMANDLPLNYVITLHKLAQDSYSIRIRDNEKENSGYFIYKTITR